CAHNLLAAGYREGDPWWTPFFMAYYLPGPRQAPCKGHLNLLQETVDVGLREQALRYQLRGRPRFGSPTLPQGWILRWVRIVLDEQECDHVPRSDFLTPADGPPSPP
ncbi:hypothetical protein H1C71_008075, partial [Ictidomys tridecemlineatus]